MSQDDSMDVIIVGAGLSGCTAAYLLAQSGLEVLVIERGNFAGSKNMTGGRLYAHSLEKIIPGFAQQAPIERKVTREKISFMTVESAITLDYHSTTAQQAVQESYTVLRGPFDQWLMAKAEEAGAQFIGGIRVEQLLVRDGKVCGVQADGDQLEAKVVILADGVNSLLGQQIGMVKPLQPQSVAVGVKELIELPSEAIEERFGVSGKDGAAWLFAGSPSNGLMGGGFLYTNKNSISLGIVCGLHHIDHSDKSIAQMLEDFKHHPSVAPLIKGGRLAEYSAHLVPEAGICMLPELVRDGVIIAGDAAGFCINAGYTIRGMDLAIASGQAAAEAVLAARKQNDYRKQGLVHYEALLNDSFVMKDLKLYKNLPGFLENPRIFNQYPKMVEGMMSDLFTVDGRPAEPLHKKMRRQCKRVGYWNLIKDAVKGVRSI